ncbi:hypothetical protein [Natrinema salinisoli]|uniref:hypothetical protein n=1 Tax=Natrinema salinisoli TaxID=2878535 RepID=UPI001CF008E7|nr:hypothetical protein [Natrinema salinisoli]
MSKSIQFSDAFYQHIASHNRDDESIEETLRRLIGGPNPDAVSGILSAETAATMREQLSESSENGLDE